MSSGCAAFVFGRAALECGTLTIEPARSSCSSVLFSLLRGSGSGTSSGMGRVGLGTLLGPEASVVAISLVGVGPSFSADQCRLLLGAAGLRYRPCVENFTVDASIFVVTTSY